VGEHVDVAVIGGGPSGSTVAGLLAKEGYSVLVVERQKFPRYIVGESLVPGVLPVLQELELFEETESRGFVFKPGLTVRWGPHRPALSIFFGDTGLYKGAYQVVRAEYDQLLLQNARRLGATVLEDTRVVDVLFEGDRCVGLQYAAPDGGELVTVQARYVVDASGQSALLARRLNLLEVDEYLKNVAIWTYYQGVLPFEGRAVGNTLVENMSDGWLWVIPLNDGTTSVGWVTPANKVRGRKNLESVFEKMIYSSIETKRVLEPARRVCSFRTARDWSYIARRSHGPGFLLAGDAAGFVDPLFSTGVFIAMSAGRLASRALIGAMKEPAREAELFGRYDETYKKFLGDIFSIVRYFYASSQDTEAYWDTNPARDPMHQMVTRPDFISLVSGMQGVRTVMSFEKEGLELLLEQNDEVRTPRQLFQELGEVLAREPQRTKGMTATFQFNIVGDEGGNWYVRAKDGAAEVGEGQAEGASCLLSMSESVWKAIASGRVSGNAAFMLGKIKVDGDVRVASQTARIFGGGGPLVTRSAPGQA
jgi:FAD-dependent halogenase